MQEPNRIRSIAIRISIFGALIAFILYPLSEPGMRDKSRVKISLIEIISIAAAMESYKKDFGTYPTGDNPTVFGALRGNNPKKLILLDVHPRSISADGAFVDPWQTPYEIKVSSTNSVSVRSAGKNKRFGDADDVTNSP